jgi:osmotically-inducible protein OsmY
MPRDAGALRFGDQMMTSFRLPGFRRAILASLLAGAALAQSGCFPLAATGIAVGAMAAADRRTIGTQTEDQGIEVKALQRMSELKGGSGVSATSFNRKVLLTGQVPDQRTKAEAGTIIAKVDSVLSVHNELAIGERVGFGTQASDSSVTTRVKAAMVDTKDLQANTIKVVTEAGVVYLMGIVTRAEGERAAQVASRVSGVRRVVTVFEYVTPDELARIERQARESAQ